MQSNELTDEKTEQATPHLVILAHGRSGSSTLSRIIKEYSSTSIDAEPFHAGRHWGFDYRSALENGFTLPECLRAISRKHFGIKHLIGQLNLGNEVFLFQACAERILLTRRNQLKAIVSAMIAEQTKQWHLNGKERSSKTLEPFSLSTVDARLRRQRSRVATLKSILEEKEVVYEHLYYEDIFGKNIPLERRLSVIQGVLKKLSLSVDDSGVQEKVIDRLRHDVNKVNVRSTYLLVPNIQEVEKELASDTNGSLEL